VKARVDHFHARIAQRSGNQFHPAIMAVESDFADEDAFRRRRYCNGITS
jgi:hypothetical protein